MKRRIVAMLCAVCVLLFLCPFFAAADSLEDDMLGTVSEKYESNGNPGTISGGTGDLGGASYGAYQFAGNFDVPLTFARWCVSSRENSSFGNRLIAAYEKDKNAFGEAFNAEWKALAAEDSDEFYRLQRLYVKERYYKPAVAALKSNFNLDIENYGIAFKNAVWSRTVQHGLGSYSSQTGFMGIMRQVEQALPNGLLATSEDELITAVYEESGKVVTTGTNPMLAAKAGGNAWIIRQYDLEGKYMKYYSGNSAAVQAGVYLRLRVNEIKDLLHMFVMFGGYEGSNNYGKVAPVLRGTTLMLSDCDGLRGWNAGENTSIAGTTEQKQQGSGALLLLPIEQGDEISASATLNFSVKTNMTGFTRLSVKLYLPAEQTTKNSNFILSFLQGTETVFTGEWSLVSLAAGWHTVTFALPAAEDIGTVDALNIKFEGLSGTMSGRRFILDDVRAVTDQPKQTLQSATVNADALNCRSGPDTDFTALGQFSQNTTVTVMGQKIGDWYFCFGANQNGQTILGWCSGEYLILKEYTSLMGDVNYDSTVNAVDALLILRYAVNKASMTQDQQAIADLNADGQIDAKDALEVLRIAVNKR